MELFAFDQTITSLVSISILTLETYCISVQPLCRRFHYFTGFVDVFTIITKIIKKDFYGVLLFVDIIEITLADRAQLTTFGYSEQ